MTKMKDINKEINNLDKEFSQDIKLLEKDEKGSLKYSRTFRNKYAHLLKLIAEKQEIGTDKIIFLTWGLLIVTIILLIVTFVQIIRN